MAIINNNPLKGYLISLLLCPELFAEPNVFRKVNSMTVAQLKTAMRFLAPSPENKSSAFLPNREYLKKSVANTLSFFD